MTPYEKTNPQGIQQRPQLHHPHLMKNPSAPQKHEGCYQKESEQGQGPKLVTIRI
jgi:hypothetical protein